MSGMNTTPKIICPLSTDDASCLEPLYRLPPPFTAAQTHQTSLCWRQTTVPARLAIRLQTFRQCVAMHVSALEWPEESISV